MTLNGKLELANAVIDKLDTWSVYTPEGILNNEVVQQVNKLHHKVQYMKEHVKNLQKMLSIEDTDDLVVEDVKYKESLNVENLVKETEDEPQIVQQEQDNLTTTERSVTSDQTMTVPTTIKTSVENILTTPKSTNETVAEPKKAFEKEDQAENVIVIEDLYIKKHLEVNKINGHLATSLLKTDDEINLIEKILIIKGDLTVEKDLHVTDRIDNIQFTKENLLLTDGDQNIPTTLRVSDIKVNDLYSPLVNNQPMNVFVEQKLNEIVGNSEPIHQFDEIVVDELFVNGDFNNLDIRLFDSSLLKSQGDQVLEAPFIIDNLSAKNIKLINSGTICNKKSEDLISIENGTYIVNSMAAFTKPIHARYLIASKRINNIDIEDGHMDILLKNASYNQVISAPKVFDTVHLMNPIGLQGKINSEVLQNMNPVMIIEDDLVLEGDYEINGETVVRQLLKSYDLVGKSGEYSAQRLFRHGLKLDAQYSDKHFTFVQPIRVQDLHTMPSSDFNPDDFVKTNTDEIQVVTGHKTILGDLTVKEGICEANEVNKVDIDHLDKTVLKKIGDQVVDGSIHFESIVVQGPITAEETTLSDVPLSHLLTVNSDQTITGTVTINGPVIVENSFEVRDLYTTGSFGDGNLEFLIQDTVLNDGREYHITGEKIIEHATIGDLKFAPNSGRLNGINMDTLVWDLDIFSEKNIFINDSLYQTMPLSIQNLHVSGSINGINGNEFGKTWLLSHGEQEFTSPVTLQNVIIDSNLDVEGKVNGHDINYLYENTIWTDKDETLGTIKANYILSDGSVIVDGYVSGLKIEEDILLSNGTDIQNIENLIVNELIVQDTLNIKSTLNDVDYKRLSEFANPMSTEPKNLRIASMANFIVQPVFDNINGINVDELYDNSWIADRSTTLKGNYHFGYAEFTNGIVSTVSRSFVYCIFDNDFNFFKKEKKIYWN